MNLVCITLSFWYCFLTRIFGFYHVSQRISRIPYIFGLRIRYFYYKKQLTALGENVVFSYGTILSHKDISIGHNVRIGPYNTIGLVDIGDDFMSAQFVHLMSGSKQHGYERTDIPMRSQQGVLSRIKIEQDVWIGVNSIVMANIGIGVVIGANSLVTKPIDDYGVAVGNPAKIIKYRK